MNESETLSRFKEILDIETQQVDELENYWLSKYTEEQPEFVPVDKWFRRWIRWYGMELSKHAIDVAFVNLGEHVDCVRLAKYTQAVARNIRDFLDHARHLAAGDSGKSAEQAVAEEVQP